MIRFIYSYWRCVCVSVFKIFFFRCTWLSLTVRITEIEYTVNLCL